MTRIPGPVPPLARVPLLFVVSLALALPLAGCASPADDPRNAAATGSSARPSSVPLCPVHEGSENEPKPSPCISQDWNDRVRENHAYREEMPITAAQRAEAEPRARALAAALKRLAGTGATEDALREAAAEAIGVEPSTVEIRGEFGASEYVDLGGGHGKVCVLGHLHKGADPTAEVTGRTNDGTCLPGLGGH
jgi:hypothetical protein